jgi:ABC-type uncharacterized transport system substrate-binding protein
MARLFRAVLGALLWLCLSASQAGTVVIVTSDHNRAYAQAAEALTDQLRRAGVVQSDITRLTAAEIVPPLLLDHTAEKLWVALGTEALSRILASPPRAPVLAAMIPRTSFERVLRESGKKYPAGITAIYLDQPFARQLDLLHLALPEARRLGVLWGSESMALQAALVGAARAGPWELVSGSVVTSESIFAGLRDALENADVLLAVADAQVFNGTTLPNILLTTYRARIPVMAFSPAYVKAGALLSLHSTPLQIGNQTGSMARAVLLGAALPAPQYPLEFTVSVNDYVARSLGLTLDAVNLTERLRQMERHP